MTGTAAPGTDVAVPQPLSAELVATFSAMAMLIPNETTDAVESIITAILAAPSWDELDTPWESQGMAKIEGKTVIINTLTRRPSDFKDGLGIFLVVHCTDPSSGESIVVTTSATAVVAQLVRAYCQEWLPIYAQVVVAERATERGYKPHHLKFLGPSRPADPAF
jgi:hypothetical protein